MALVMRSKGSSFEERDVFQKELLLQRLGGGGDNDALAQAQHRDQIGERLARTGAGFHDEVTLLGERLLDCLRHLELPAAELVSRMRPRQQPAGTKESMERVGERCGLG
jgi:hypothetical protein